MAPVRGRGTKRGTGRGNNQGRSRTNSSEPFEHSTGQESGHVDAPHQTQPSSLSVGDTSSFDLLTPNPQIPIAPSHSDQPTSDPSLAPQSSEQSETCSSRKKVISITKVPNPRRFVPQTVTRDIMENILNRMHIPAETWKDYPMDMKDILFNDFKDKYQFATDYDQKMARTVLDRYPDTLKKARAAALEKANSTNLADIKGNGPRGMKSEVWDGLVDIWLRPEWQRKSEAGRRNRASMPDHMLHTGGSISFGEHKRRMEMKLNRQVAFKEIYDHVHKKKDGEYVSEHSKNAMESYEMAMTEKYGEDPSTFPEVDPDVWLEASGSSKKGRVLGVGHSLDIGIPDPRRDLLSDGASHPNSRPVTHADVTEAINAALPAALNAALSTFVQSQLVPLLSMIPGYKPTNVASPGKSTNGENQDNVDKDNAD